MIDTILWILTFALPAVVLVLVWAMCREIVIDIDDNETIANFDFNAYKEREL